MSEPLSLAELLGTAAPAKDTRACRSCGVTKQLVLAEWPHVKSKPVGNLCRVCEAARQAQKGKDRAARLQKARAAGELAAMPLDHAATPEAKARNAEIVAAREALGVKGTKADVSKLEIAHALKEGARFLNEFAPIALTRLMEYIEDIEHPLHQWAIQFVVERALPRKLYEELGSKEAGVGGPTDKRPTFVVNVVQAQAAPPEPAKQIAARVTVTPIEERPDEQQTDA